MPLFALPTSLRLLERLHGNSSAPVVLVTHMGSFNVPKGNCSIYPQDRAWSDGRRERQVAALWANPVAAQQFHGGIQAALESLIYGDDDFHEFIHKHLERLRTGETSWPALQNTYHLATTCTISLPNSAPTEFEVSAVACILEHDSGLDDAKCATGPVQFQCCFLPWACSRLLSGAPKQPNPGDNRQDPYWKSEELFRLPETSRIALLLQFHAVRSTAAAAQARPPHLQSPSPSLQNLPPTLPPTPEMCSTQVLEEQPSPPNPPAITLTDKAAAILASSAPAGRGATIAASDAAMATSTWLPFKMHPQPCTYEVVDVGTRATCNNGLDAEREDALSLHSTLRDTCKGASLQLCTAIASAAGGAAAAAAAPIAAAATATAPPLSSREPKGESWHRSCMVLAALPVCVSLFDRQGCMLFQNAASMYYFGPRSNMPQLDVRRTAAGTATGEGAIAAGTAAGPVGLSSAPRPAAGSRAVVQGATSRGLLSKLRALRCSSRRKNATGGCDGGGANEDSQFLGAATGNNGVGLTKAVEHKNILLELFAFELEKLEEMWAMTAMEGGTWQGMVRVPRTLNPDPVSSFASGITEASCPEDGGCVDASRRAAAAPEGSSVVADSSGSVAAAGRTASFPQGVAGESGAPYEAAFPRLRERRLPISDSILESSSPRKIRGVSPLAPRRPQSDLDEQGSGLAAAEVASCCQLSRSEVQASNAQSICLLPSRSSVRHLPPSGSTEGIGGGTSSGAVASAAAPVAAAFGPGEETRTGRPREVLNRDVYCDEVFVHVPTADMSSLLDGSRSYLHCPSSEAGRYSINVMAGPPGGAVPFFGPTDTTAPDGGGDGDGAVGGGPCTTADAPWPLLAARQLGRFVSRVAATVGVGSSVPVAPSDGRRCIGPRDNGAMVILHRAGSSHSRTGGGMSGGCNHSVATETAACLDDPHQQGAGLPDATSPQLPSAGGDPGSLTNKRSKVLPPSVFQTFGIGVRRLARGRSGTSIGSGSGPGEGARVQLSCASFCNAAGVSTARGPLVPLLTERRAGMSPLPTSSSAVSAVDASMAVAATDGDGSHPQRWSQRDMMIGDPAPMAAAAATTGPRPRSGSRHRRRSHSGAAQRRWASVNTLSTSTWQVAFGGSGLKAPPVYGHLMVSAPRPHLPSRHCLEARGSTELPCCGGTAAGTAEARQLQPTIGGADGATAIVAGSAAGPATAVDLDTSMPTRSTSDCCMVDAARSGCAAVQSSSPARGGWGVPPPSSTALDLDACETSAAASAAPQPQTPHPIGRPGEPWVASAVGATEASRSTAPGKNGTADKLRPLPGDRQPRMVAGGDGVHSLSNRGWGSRCGTGFGYVGNGASSPPVLVPRGQLFVAYNSSSDVSRDSRAQSFESNLNAAYASNTSMVDRARAQDANVALLAISPSRLGGGGAGTAAALSSRVVTFAASLRTAPKTYSAAAAAGAGRVTARSKSDRRMSKRYIGGDVTTFMASSLSRASFSQPGPHNSNVFSSAVDRSAFWTVRYTNGDSCVSEEFLYATEGGVEEPDKAFGGNSRQRRYAASCYNSGGGGSTAATVRDKVSQMRAVSEHASTLMRSAGTYRRIAAKRLCDTSLGMTTGSTPAAAAAETELARKAAAVAGNVRYGDEEIQACEEAGVPIDVVGSTDAEVMVTAGPSGPIPDAANFDAARQRRKPYEQASFCSDGASGAESGAQHRMQSSLMSPAQDSGTTGADATEAMVSKTTAEANVTAGAAGASAGAVVPGGEAELSSECWHEVVAVGVVDPASGRRGVVVMQRDVTAKVVAERHVAQVSETEHRLLEQIFPRHVLQYIMEESGLWAASAEEASAAEPDADLDQNRFSKSSISTTTPVDAAAIARWRPYVRDCNRLAVWHPQVTVLFADIQGFTPMCKVLPPDVVMSFLNTLFTRFDAMLDRHHVYKVETIGDCYMVAGGLIREDEDGMASVQGGGHVDPDQAGNVFAFAKAMLAAASSVALPTTGAPVKVRVGIHSGPVVSGVVGTRMPRFCLFGDTVNTASRMESSGVAGCIHVSEECFQLLRKRDPEAAEGWEATGGIEVKGKGLMRTHLWTPDHLRAQAAITVPAATTANTTGTINSTTTMATAAITANTVPPSATSAAASDVCRDPQEQLQKIPQETVLGTAVAPNTDTSGAVAAPGLLSSAATRPPPAPFLGHAWTILGAESERRQRERDQALGHGVTSVGGGSGCGGLAVSNMSSACPTVTDAFAQHGANAGSSAICVAQKTTGTASVASGGASSRAGGVTTAGDRAGRGDVSISIAGCEAGCAGDSASGGGSAGVEAGDDGHRRGGWNGVDGERSNLGQDQSGGPEPDVSKEAGPPMNSMFTASCHTTSTDLRWSSRHAMDFLDPTIGTTIDSVALGSTSTRRALAGASTGGSGRGVYHMLRGSSPALTAAAAAAAAGPVGGMSDARRHRPEHRLDLVRNGESSIQAFQPSTSPGAPAGTSGIAGSEAGSAGGQNSNLRGLNALEMANMSTASSVVLAEMLGMG
ncbi:hypothetical protein Vretifemale_17131, partial [Volvox reticuliferus]